MPDEVADNDLEETLRISYLSLLKGCLTRLIFMNDGPGRDNEALAERRRLRESGLDWPGQAETMIGMVRLECIQACVQKAIREGVPGDLLEAGVWRGGAAIFMRALLLAFGDRSRVVWVADSFEGLPPPDSEHFTQDSIDLSGYKELAVGLDEVKANFARYNMLDDRVRFLKGLFKDTLSAAPIERLAVLRLDGDYYESTIQCLESLYGKVSPGGFVLVDDYFVLEPCRQAVEDFRVANSIYDELVTVGVRPGTDDPRGVGSSVYWRKRGSGD